jgi:hypothetical protein
LVDVEFEKVKLHLFSYDFPQLLNKVCPDSRKKIWMWTDLSPLLDGQILFSQEIPALPLLSTDKYYLLLKVSQNL